MEIFIRIKVHRLHIYVVVLLALAHFSLRVDSLVAALVLSTGILKRLKRSWCSFGWEARCRDALAEFVGDTLDLKPKSQLSPALLGPAKRAERLLRHCLLWLCLVFTLAVSSLHPHLENLEKGLIFISVMPEMQLHYRKRLHHPNITPPHLKDQKFEIQISMISL